ncbi:MAG: hypothetical protein OEV49_01215 [candidate division Zixibacteria bacterium]|nr:hypothetical protein [candidate division Zixibacteria bacterium]MDH3937190.1 hypothetical protein [candidate division Zixibacteria bacterium]MDH4032453.1 hypothetical protein [candidate division Zixibacteria bacterium]
MASEQRISDALTQVVHLPLNIKKGEGIQLGERYSVGPYFPVFILTNSEGAVINRWTGYTGAERFLRSFYKAMSNLTPIAERIAAFDKMPSHAEALFLASYHADISEFVKAAKYYQRAQTLNGSSTDYSYQVFENYANAAWNDQIPFDDVLPAADAVLEAPRKNLQNIASVAQLICKLARRRDATDRIAKYLQAGIAASGARKDDKGRKLQAELKADQALYVHGDTLGAIEQKKSGFGENWDTNLNNYLPFATYCFERRINLEEAQRFVETAAQRASDGSFKAKHLSLLANICEARGNFADALRHAEAAAVQDPDNEAYAKQLLRMREAAGR